MTSTSRSGPLARVLASAAAVSLLAACGGGASGGGAAAGGSGEDLAAVSADDLQGTKLRLARFFGDCEDSTQGVTDVAKATTECETIQILTNAFNDENTSGIEVTRLGGAEWNTYYDTLNAAYAGGNPPDVAVMHGSSITNYAKRNLLLPLDDDVLEVTKTDLGDAAPAAKEAVTYQDKTYGVPFDLHAGLVHLNVDLFKQAGLVDAAGKPVMPTSTEEFLQQAEQVKTRTGKDYFGTARVKDGLGVHMWRSLIQQQGGSVLNDDRTEATVDTPEAREALGFMDEVFSRYADPAQTYDAAQSAFLSGETAMLFNGTWVVDQYDKEASFTYQTADFPTLYEEPAIWADSHTWVIPRQKEADPAKYRAALEFVNYLYDHSGDWAIHTGHLAARSSVLASPDYEKAPQRANYVKTGTTNASLVPSVSNWQGVQDTLIKQMDSIWFQGASVDEALAEADRQVDTILAQK